MGNNLCACGIIREKNEAKNDNKILDIIDTEHQFIIINNKEEDYEDENNIYIIDNYIS